jgi:PAS domain S-box-containing protein
MVKIIRLILLIFIPATAIFYFASSIDMERSTNHVLHAQTKIMQAQELAKLVSPLQITNIILLISAALFIFLINAAKNEAKQHEAMLTTIFENAKDSIFWVDENGIIINCNKAAASLLDKKKSQIIGQQQAALYPPSKAQRYVEHINEQLSAQNACEDEIELITEKGEIIPTQITASCTRIDNKNITQIIGRDISERRHLEALKDEFLGTVSHELRTPLTTVKETISQTLDGILGPTTDQQREFLSLCLEDIERLVRIINGLLDISKIEAGKIKMTKEPVDMVALTHRITYLFASRAKETGLELKTDLPEGSLEAYVDKDRVIQIFTNLLGNAFKFTEKGSITISIKEKARWVECFVTDTGKGIAAENLPKLFNRFEQVGRAQFHKDGGTGLGLSIAKGLVENHGGKIWAESTLGQGTRFCFLLPKYERDPIIWAIAADAISMANARRQPLSIFVIKIADPEIAFNPPTPNNNHNLHEIILEIENVLKTNEKFTTLIGKNEIMVLASVGKAESAATQMQLKRMIKNFIFEATQDSRLNFSYGRASFPEDANNPRELLRIADASVIDEHSEQKTKRILLVDDEVLLVEGVERWLNHLGYMHIDTAHDGQEALKRIDDITPDLIVLDMSMPKMSGYEVIGRLKQNIKTQSIPILIVSAYEVETEKFRQYTANAIPAISKPTNLDLLQKWVEYLL